MAELIGLHGLKGVGKDTVAAYLVEQYGFEQKSFAKVMKEAVCALFDITLEDVEYWKLNLNVHVEITNYDEFRQDSSQYREFTFRQMLQRFGTEMGREVFGQDFWVNLLLDKYDRESTQKWVISDARFENELRAIVNYGGHNFVIHRPGYVSDGHASEQVFPWLCAGSIDNHGTLERLYSEVDTILQWYGIKKCQKTSSV